MVFVSGGAQSGTLSALDTALVVQLLDGADRPVPNVPVTWTVMGGGSLSATSTTTDSAGKSQVTWTLAPVVGAQAVTATSLGLGRASISFVTNNGAIITGVVTPSSVNPFGATYSRAPGRAVGVSVGRASSRRPSPSSNRIVVGFRNNALGVAAAGSGAYRSLSVARMTMSTLQDRVSTLAAAHPIRNARISPAMLAARFDVSDPTQIEPVMASLRSNPDVAWVERDELVSIHDGKEPHAQSPSFIPTLAAPASAPLDGSSSVVAKLPNDPFLWEQLWPTNMIDLPKAWSVTTGSSNVVVAVVDMGIRFDHADIAANLTTDGYDFVSQVGFGTTEIICPSTANPAGGTFTTIDGDGDGPDPDPTDPNDLEFDDAAGCWRPNSLGDHGLWTSGIIGAVGNEGVGVAGVNWNVKIRAIRVLGITGQGTNFDIAQGVLYAAGLPATGANDALVQAPSRAPIINMSLGGGSPSNTLATAITAASNAGSLIVASAGNEGLDFPSYPAAFPEVMGVAAVGMDGQLATYSNAGTYISVAAPGGDFRLDDNGGGAVLGPAYNFDANRPAYVLGYGTSASAPYVSGIAALLLAKEPNLTAAQLRSRIEQYATRPAGTTRSDTYGWGIVNAYNSLTQQNGAPRTTLARLVNATTGAVVKTTPVAPNGSFAFTRLLSGSVYLQVGDDESSDGVIGTPGRRFATAGGVGAPTIFNVNGNSQAAAILLGLPMEVEPNDDVQHANVLSVGSYVVGSITTPDVRDVYSVTIPTAGTYTFETSGVVGSCGLGIELDTFLSVASASGTVIGTNDNFTSTTGRFCSRVQASFTPGTYYATVTGTAASGLSSHGRYRLEVRAGQ
jgi:subtilisin family serine protease